MIGSESGASIRQCYEKVFCPLHQIIQYMTGFIAAGTQTRTSANFQKPVSRLWHLTLTPPVSPYVGDILNAPVIILGANAGYSEDKTPSEFVDQAAIDKYIMRVRNPATADWSEMAQLSGSKLRAASARRRCSLDKRLRVSQPQAICGAAQSSNNWKTAVSTIRPSLAA